MRQGMNWKLLLWTCVIVTGSTISSHSVNGSNWLGAIGGWVIMWGGFWKLWDYINDVARTNFQAGQVLVIAKTLCALEKMEEEDNVTE